MEIRDSMLRAGEVAAGLRGIGILDDRVGRVLISPEHFLNDTKMVKSTETRTTSRPTATSVN